MWPPKHIEFAGVELEGGFDTAEKPTGYHHDGSVTVRHNWVGENVSPPMKAEALLKWIDSDNNYPAVINDTCGLHVHTSFYGHNDYALLMEKNFWELFLVEMERWGKAANVQNKEFWKRLKGENRYCFREFYPHEQFRMPNKNYRRYTQLNYCHALHGTLECRLLPMFKSRLLAVAAVKNYLKFTDDHISRHRRTFNKRVEHELLFEEQTALPLSESYDENSRLHPLAPDPRRTVDDLLNRATYRPLLRLRTPSTAEILDTIGAAGSMTFNAAGNIISSGTTGLPVEPLEPEPDTDEPEDEWGQGTDPEDV